MKYFSLLLFLLFFTFANAQNSSDTLSLNSIEEILPPNNKPIKVGVVLSGGGAKGLAHVGVLKIIEEAGIKIDYIAGTSMGAIVGGLYASGWTATELDSLLHVYDLAALMQDQIPRDAQPFFEKEYGEKYAFSLSFQDYHISLPSALSNGQDVFNFFNQLTKRVRHVNDFRLLPIPFFCIGTDMETGDEIVIERGSLAKAMRGSGSFPGLLSPVKIGDHLIADGGIVNNFPAKKLKEKGMDYVIGVNVEDGLYKKDELQSIDKLLMQISSYNMVNNSKTQLIYCDVLMYPDVSGYGITSFEGLDVLLRNGEKEALSHWKKLKEIAAIQKKTTTKNIALPVVTSPDILKIKEISIDENEVYTAENMHKFFTNENPEKNIEDVFYEGITKLYATNNFQFIDYTFKSDPSGEDRVLITPVPKLGYDKLLRVGLHYDNIYKSSLLINATLHNFKIKNSIASLNLILGDRFRYTFNYRINAGKGLDFGINSQYHLNEIPYTLPPNVFVDSILRVDELAFYYNDFSNEAYFNIFSNSKSAIGLNSQVKYFSTGTDQILDTLTDKSYRETQGFYFSEIAYFKFDSRNDRHFPRKGGVINLLARFTLPFATKQFEVENKGWSYNFDLIFMWAFSVSKHVTVGVSGDIGITLGESTSPFLYYLGGNNLNTINNFKPFLGLSFANHTGQNLQRASLYLQFIPFKNNYITLSGNIAYLDDELKPFSKKDNTIYSLGLGYGLGTPLGPIELTLGVSNKNTNLYFNLGYWF